MNPDNTNPAPSPAPEPSIPPVSDPTPSISATPEPVLAPEPAIPPVSADSAMPVMPSAPVEPAPAPVEAMPDMAAAPAVDPVLPPASNMPLETPAATDPLAPIQPVVPDAVPADPVASVPDPMAGSQTAMNEALSEIPSFGAPAAEAPLETPAVDPSVAPAPEAPAYGMASSDFTSDPSVAAAPEQPVEDLPPIEPAAPVPGSIGSSQSYTEPAPAPVDAAAPAAPKKNKTTLILIIALVAIAAVGGIIFAIVMMNSGSSSNNNSGNNNTAVTIPDEPINSTLSCTKEATAEELSTAGSATSWSSAITVKYEDDTMTEYSEVSTIIYGNKDDASFALNNIFKTNYNSAVAAAGYSEDPFDSYYRRVDNTLTITHTASSSVITTKNAAIINIPVDDDGLDTSESSVQKNFEKLNYVCELTED